jgi:signal transduction histidine kinase
MRNHLAALDVLAQLIPLKKKDPDFIATLEKVFPREITRLLELTERYLNLARPSKGEWGRVDWSGLVERVMDLMAPMFRAKGRTLKWTHPKGLVLPGAVCQLESLVLNLVRNALEASQSRGEVRVVTRRDVARRELIFEVWNNAKPIDAKDLKRLFEPFYTTKEKGTGLGLAICHWVVENHRGSIRAEAVGKKILFQVRLPLSEDSGKRRTSRVR